jgi:two-component system, cell cycle response regulator DivK
MTTDARPSRSRKQILVVDDDEDARLLLSLILDSAGFDVDTASDGLEAVLKLERSKPDLLLLDLMMPVFDGWEVIHSVRTNAATHELPILVISAKFGLINTREHDVQGYVRKPIVPMALLDALDQVLRQGTMPADQ